MASSANNIRDTLLALGSATLGESGGRPLVPGIRPAWPGARLAGPARTVRCAPGDNLAVHVAVANAPVASVLVVEIEGDPNRGYWGEVLTTAAEALGVAGLVIEGGVRDVAALEAHGFPVFSTTIALRGAAKVGPGSVGERVRVGGVDVAPGDWVVGDVDGITVVPSDQLDEVMSSGQARADKEAALFRELKAGRTTVELLGLDPSTIEQSD
ncbi:MAG: dimethylmenaquinone methyltransferase [Acidimicrobiia bacterium]|nr:dimethylmenaquinone methyltransferase [Acidimicrobiia bacterium]